MPAGITEGYYIARQELTIPAYSLVYDFIRVRFVYPWTIKKIRYIRTQGYNERHQYIKPWRMVTLWYYSPSSLWDPWGRPIQMLRLISEHPPPPYDLFPGPGYVDVSTLHHAYHQMRRQHTKIITVGKNPYPHNAYVSVEYHLLKFPGAEE